MGFEKIKVHNPIVEMDGEFLFSCPVFSKFVVCDLPFAAKMGCISCDCVKRVLLLLFEARSCVSWLNSGEIAISQFTIFELVSFVPPQKRFFVFCRFKMISPTDSDVHWDFCDGDGRNQLRWWIRSFFRLRWSRQIIGRATWFFCWRMFFFFFHNRGAVFLANCIILFIHYEFKCNG